MKVIVISHTYITELNRRKLRAISSMFTDADIAVIVPRSWNPGGVQSKLVLSESIKKERFQVLALPNVFKHNQALLCFGVELLAFLREFRPDIIQVEQGAKSIAYAQIIMLNWLFKLKAKNVFFTWWNVPYSNNILISALEQFNLSASDGLIAGNADAIKILSDHGYSGPSIVLPQLGVDSELFNKNAGPPDIRDAFKFSESDFVVGFIGRFVEEKGIRTLLCAFQKLRSKYNNANSIKLLCVGRGPLKGEIENLQKELADADTVFIKENVAHEEIPKYLSAMNVLVLPSETQTKQTTMTSRGWKEQFGHVLIEAMAAYVPVIGSDSGEIPNVIGSDGLIFPEKDAVSLAECMEQLFLNKRLCLELSEKGRQRVLKDFTDEVLAVRQYEFWKSLKP